MTKQDLARAVADELDIPTAQAHKAVQRTFEGIIEALEQEGRIELRNFGVFEVRKRKSRQARNPRTGEVVFVPEKAVVAFKPGRIMEEE